MVELLIFSNHLEARAKDDHISLFLHYYNGKSRLGNFPIKTNGFEKRIKNSPKISSPTFPICG
jgi:hypothetical protein